jgi:hypothetical protein
LAHVEASRDQTSDDSGGRLCVQASRVGTLQPALQRVFEQCLFIHFGEHFIHGRFCHRRGDAQLLNFLERATATMSPDWTFHACCGEGDSTVIHGPIPRQARDGVVYVGGIELASGQSRTDLGDRQLTPGEPGERGGVGVRRYPPNRVISGCFFGSDPLPFLGASGTIGPPPVPKIVAAI